MQNTRYPGTYWFSKAQSHIFFGRENDIENLQTLVESEKQVLLYSKSGVGKTSLLNAGVFPRLPDYYQLIEIRFTAHKSTDSISPLQRILDYLYTVFPELKSVKNTILDYLSDEPEDLNSLWFNFKKIQILDAINSENSVHAKVYLFVFDQFEELFSYPAEDIDQFKQELYELSQISLPSKYSKLMAEKRHEYPEIITRSAASLLQKKIPVKTLFSIRSDRLSLLNKLSDKLPDIQQKFYELLPLSNEQAKEAIIKPAMQTGNFDSRPFRFTDQALHRILKFLTSDFTQNVESIQLQIICRRIED